MPWGGTSAFRDPHPVSNPLEDLHVRSISRHLTRCFIAGIVALLPIGGAIFTVVTLEKEISDSWLARQPFYFPGMGIVAAAIFVYLIGLAVSTFVGRWAWARFDAMLDGLPALGKIYQTLKQILGYGEGKDAVFRKVVLVPSRDVDAHELGLVTNESKDEQGKIKMAVFLPGSPNPTNGRLLWVDPDRLREIPLPVSEALKTLVAVGKADLVPELGMPGEEA
jgi:uncharacterized membrane protein